MAVVTKYIVLNKINYQKKSLDFLSWSFYFYSASTKLVKNLGKILDGQYETQNIKSKWN